MTSTDPNGIESFMREGQDLAQPEAQKLGVALRGAHGTDDATIDTDGDGSFESWNPDTGAGTEPGHNFIHCIGDGPRVLWTLTEDDVVRLAVKSGSELAQHITRMLSVHPGKPVA